MNIIIELTEALSAMKNDHEAQRWKAYMKGHFEYFGVATNDRRKILKPLIEKYHIDLRKNYDAVFFELMQTNERELHHCGMEIFLEYFKKNVKSNTIQFIENMILTNSWWDTVDFLAKYGVGGYLELFPEQKYQVIEKFSNSQNMWLNRTAIIWQLGKKQKTDFDILISECEKHKHSDEFFIQKAIGWALRDYAHVNPTGVLDYVNNTNLKPLSKKEAIRKII